MKVFKSSHWVNLTLAGLVMFLGLSKTLSDQPRPLILEPKSAFQMVDPVSNTEAPEGLEILATKFDSAEPLYPPTDVWMKPETDRASNKNAGTTTKPRTLLLEMPPCSRAVAEVPEVRPPARVKLQVWLGGLDDLVTWTVVGPDGTPCGTFYNYFGVYAGASTTSIDQYNPTQFNIVSFNCMEMGWYTFYAKSASGKEGRMDVYVVRPYFSMNPKYIFANANARVPFELGVAGLNGNNFAIANDSGGKPDLTVMGNGLNFAVQADRFAPEFLDTSSQNGLSDHYKFVTLPKGFSAVRDTNGKGLFDALSMRLQVRINLVLPGGEETNIVLAHSLTDDVTDQRFVDNKYYVIEISNLQTFDLGVSNGLGKGQFDHLRTDDPSYECWGYAMSTNEAKKFVAQPGWTFGYWPYKDDQRHYHTDKPRGFNESDDIALAGVTKTLDAQGFSMAAELWSPGHWGGSDDEEEYVAKALGAGIAHTTFVSYKPMSTPYLGAEIYDLDNSTTAHVSPFALKYAQFLIETHGDKSEIGNKYAGVALDTASTALGTASLIMLMAGPPGWVATAVTWAAFVISVAASANDINSYIAYGDHKQSAILRIGWGVQPWDPVGPYDSGSLACPGIDVGGSNATVHYPTGAGGFGPYGIWESDRISGRPVHVGDRVTTAIEGNCTAQNESSEWCQTADVFSKISLSASAGFDIRKVQYVWH